MHSINTRFSWRLETRQLLHIALPIIAAQLLSMGMGVIDTLMAGRINALSLAAIALGSSIWGLVMLVGMGVMMALSPTIAQHLGAQQGDKIRAELHQGAWLGLGVGGILSVILVLLAYNLPLFGVQADIVPEAQRFLFWVAWSLPFSCWYALPRSLNETHGRTLPMLWVQLALLPLNILGNYLFMFGHGGFPALGAAGAALSTGIAQTVGCCLLFAYTLKTKYYQPYRLLQNFSLPNLHHLWELLRLGLPISASLGMEISLFTSVAVLMGNFGIANTAGHQIAMNVASLTFMVPLGMAMAITVQVGHALGAHNPTLARQRSQLGVLLCAGFMALSSLNLWFFGASIAALYTSDLAVIQAGSQFLMFAALFQLVDGLQVSAMSALRGYKDTTYPMVINAFCYWVVGMGTGIYLAFYQKIGATGLWIGLVSGLTMAALLLNARLYRLGKSHG